MGTSKTFLFLLVVGVAVSMTAAPGVVVAQGSPERPALRADPPNKPPQRDQIKRRLRAMRVRRLGEVLALDDATSSKLFPILNDYDEKFARLATRTTTLRVQLQAELRSGSPDRARIDALLDDLAQQRTARYEWERDRFAAVRKVLTPEQMGRLVTVLPRIDRQIMGETRRAIRSNR